MKALEKGKRYNLDTLVQQGWNSIEHDGYSCWDYFDAAGTYLGADQYGVEPVWADIGDADEFRTLTSPARAAS